LDQWLISSAPPYYTVHDAVVVRDDLDSILKILHHKYLHDVRTSSHSPAGNFTSPDRLGVWHAALKPKAKKPHEGQPVADLKLDLIVGKVVKRAQNQRFEHDDLTPRLAPHLYTSSDSGGQFIEEAPSMR